MKRCPKCGETKSLNDFHNNRSRKDGKGAYCSLCACANRREWHAKHLEEEAARQLAWQRKNPDRVAARAAKRRAKKAEVGGEYSWAEFVALKKATGNVCLCCGVSGEEVTLAADHVIPLDKGGPNVIQNIQPLCRSCNSSKGTKSTDYRSVCDHTNVVGH